MEYKKYFRIIKKTNGKQATIPIKNELEVKGILKYWYKKHLNSLSSHKKWTSYRNYILCLLGFNTAFRAEDLLQLKVKHLRKGYISIIEAKKRKPQNFPMNKGLHKEILDFINQYELCDQDYIFSRHPGSAFPFTKTGANKVLKEAAEGIKLKQNFSMHSMRKTFAYHIYKNTGDIIRLSKMLNHADITTTMIYICWDSEDTELIRKNVYYSGL